MTPCCDVLRIESSGAYARRDVNAIQRALQLTYLPFFDDPKLGEAVELGFTQH